LSARTSNYSLTLRKTDLFFYNQRALWSDAAAATQEENDFNASHAHAHAGCDAHACDVETGGGGSSASSTTSVGGTPLKRATDFGILEKDPDMSKPGIESMHASQVGLLTSVKHGVTPQFDTENKEHLKNMGLMTAVAIGLHNFPEGLATFVAALADMKVRPDGAFPNPNTVRPESGLPVRSYKLRTRPTQD
jgi:zinc transporter ZupT